MFPASPACAAYKFAKSTPRLSRSYESSGEGVVRIDERLTILLTGAGAPGTRGTIYALRQNPDAKPVRIVGIDANARCAGRYLVDAFHEVPFPEDQSYLDRLLAICLEEGAGIIIPQTTREIAVLSSQRERLSSAGVRAMVSGEAAIKEANDKYRLLQAFRKLELPTPGFVLAQSEKELSSAVMALGYPEQPVVVKPPTSNGMRGVRVLRENAWDVHRFLSEKPSGLEITLAELIAILRRGTQWPELLVCEFLPGTEYTVDLFIGSKAQVAIPRERVAIRSGITFSSKLERREDLSSFSARAARYLGLQYAVGFQFKLDANGTAKVLECNPRVQGTMVASVFSGTNVIWLSIQELRGEPPERITLGPDNGWFFRYWGGVSVSEGRVVKV